MTPENEHPAPASYYDGVAHGRQDAFREMRRFLLDGHTAEELWAWLDAKAGEAT